MFEQLESILRCPKTHKKLTYNREDNCYDVETENVSYPISGGIIDFTVSDTNEPESSKITKAYNKISNKYDSLITSSNVFSKLIIYLTWGGLHEEYTETVISRIPDDFNGVIVDIPVGTGIYTVQKYAKLKQATIIVVDISMEMLKKAQERYKEDQIDNVLYIHGDVGSLPFVDKSIDFVLSMNGFHSFPNKEIAIIEMARILKTNAKFSGCFYVSGKRKLSDFMVNASLKRTNLFAGPFYTAEKYTELFSKYFDFNKKNFCRSFFLYEANRNNKEI